MSIDYDKKIDAFLVQSSRINFFITFWYSQSTSSAWMCVLVISTNSSPSAAIRTLTGKLSVNSEVHYWSLLHSGSPMPHLVEFLLSPWDLFNFVNTNITDYDAFQILFSPISRILFYKLEGYVQWQQQIGKDKTLKGVPLWHECSVITW